MSKLSIPSLFVVILMFLTACGTKQPNSLNQDANQIKTEEIEDFQKFLNGIEMQIPTAKNYKFEEGGSIPKKVLNLGTDKFSDSFSNLDDSFSFEVKLSWTKNNLLNVISHPDDVHMIAIRDLNHDYFKNKSKDEIKEFIAGLLDTLRKRAESENKFFKADIVDFEKTVDDLTGEFYEISKKLNKAGGKSGTILKKIIGETTSGRVARVAGATALASAAYLIHEHVKDRNTFDATQYEKIMSESAEDSEENLESDLFDFSE